VVKANLGGLEAGLLAAIRACRSFYRQNLVWPGASDAERHPDLLPGRSVMLRCCGSTHEGEIRGIAESILRAAGI
jgi:hypothetical protein